MQFGILVVVCMASIFNCMPGILVSLFSFWFCMESHSAMNKFGQGLYMILTQYYCTLSRIHCILCVSVATYFLKIATIGL